jgi:hypothetical protein
MDSGNCLLDTCFLTSAFVVSDVSWFVVFKVPFLVVIGEVSLCLGVESRFLILGLASLSLTFVKDKCLNTLRLLDLFSGNL